MLKLYTTKPWIDRHLGKTDPFTMRHIYENHSGMLNVLFELTNTLRDDFGAVVFADPSYRPEKSKHTPAFKRLSSHPEAEDQLTYIEELDYYIHDCELLLYDTEEDSVKMISLKESRSGMYEELVERNNEKDLLIYAQHSNWFPDKLNYEEMLFKLKAMPYYASYPMTDLDFFYERRKAMLAEHKDDIVDKMFGAGTTHRPDFERLEERNYLDGARGTFSYYLKNACRYKMGLSIPGVAEVCHREIDYMAIGLPHIRLEYITQLNPPLIPNFHYISVDREKYGFIKDHNRDRVGGDEYVQAYIDRFLETKDDEEFLKFVSDNAREYYENYCSYGNRTEYLLNLLELI
jgi:hypothetical protein